MTLECANVDLDSRRDVEWRHNGVRVIKINTRTGNVARGMCHGLQRSSSVSCHPLDHPVNLLGWGSPDPPTMLMWSVVLLKI